MGEIEQLIIYINLLLIRNGYLTIYLTTFFLS